MTSWTLEGQTWEGFVWFEGLVARGVREEEEEEWRVTSWSGSNIFMSLVVVCLVWEFGGQRG